MKRLMGFFAMLALLPCAYAGEFSHNAEYRLRYQLDMDSDGTSKSNPSSVNTWSQRFKLASTFRAGEKLTGQLTLLHNADWGHTITGTGDSATGVMDGTSNGENMLLVSEAYGSWMMSNEFFLRFGRGSMSMADGRVLSVSDWAKHPYTFEGALLTWDKEFARFNIFGVKLAELTNSSTGRSDPEVNSYGLSMDWKSLPEFFKMVNIHLILVNKDASSSNNSVSLTDVNDKEAKTRYGLTLGGDVHAFDYRLTAAAHTGKITDIGNGAHMNRDGSMVDAELGFRMPELMNSRVSFLYHMDSGTASGATKNKTYDSFFYDAHENAGWMDIYNWGNLTYMQVRYTMDIMEDLSFAGQYLVFNQTEKSGSVVTGNNGGSFSASDASKSGLGSELDLALAKKYEGGLTITARAGMFMPGDEYKAASLKDNYTQLFLEGKMAF